MRGLATALRRPEQRAALQRVLTDWLLGGLGLATPVGLSGSEAVAWKEAVWDSAVDLMADANALADFLTLAAERLEALPVDARPNLLSMLRARAHWRARDRQRRSAAAPSRPGTGAGDSAAEGSADQQARLIARLAVQRIAARFEDEPGLLDVLRRLMEGETISEIAVATGVSRPTLYRHLARVRAWLSDVAAETGAAILPRTGGVHV